MRCHPTFRPDGEGVRFAFSFFLSSSLARPAPRAKSRFSYESLGETAFSAPHCVLTYALLSLIEPLIYALLSPISLIEPLMYALLKLLEPHPTFRSDGEGVRFAFRFCFLLGL